MPFSVQFSEDAARDLEEIVDYIDPHDSSARANNVLEQLEEGIATLAEDPGHTNYSHERLHLGIQESRETCFKPYRIICRGIQNIVSVLLIADRPSRHADVAPATLAADLEPIRVSP